MAHRILLCDDEPYILRAAEFKLLRAGFEVECASDGEHGWEAIQRELPKIVITDLQMPRLDGLGLVRRIREHEETNHLPAILLTAKGFELPRDEICEQLNVARIMFKPFSPRELVATVEKLINDTTDTQPYPVELSR
jgi:DNA-binding response OmpR family regulator